VFIEIWRILPQSWAKREEKAGLVPQHLICPLFLLGICCKNKGEGKGKNRSIVAKIF
jgi:hypothetical protein